METSDIPTTPLSNWQPITNKHDLAVLGKLSEEAGELVAAISRCIIQGLNECEPTTGKVNSQWLAEEIADVKALIVLAEERLLLDRTAILQRQRRKELYKEPWFESLAKAEP